MPKFLNQESTQVALLLFFSTLLLIAMPTFPTSAVWEGNQFFRFFYPETAPEIYNKVILRANIGPYIDHAGYFLLGVQRHILDFFDVLPSLESIRSILTVYFALTGFFFYRVVRYFFTHKVALGSTLLLLTHSWILGYSSYFQPIIISILTMLVFLERAIFTYKNKEKAHWVEIVFLLLIIWFLGAYHGGITLVILLFSLFWVFLPKRISKKRLESLELPCDLASSTLFTLRALLFGAATALACTHYIFVRFVVLAVSGLFILRLLSAMYEWRWLKSRWFEEAVPAFKRSQVWISLASVGYFLLLLINSHGSNLRTFGSLTYLRLNTNSYAESVFTQESELNLLETIWFNVKVLWVSYIQGRAFFDDFQTDLANFFLDGFYPMLGPAMFVASLLGSALIIWKSPLKVRLLFLASLAIFFVLPLLSVVQNVIYVNPTMSTHRVVFSLLSFLVAYVVFVKWCTNKFIHNTRVKTFVAASLIVLPCSFQATAYYSGMVEYRNYVHNIKYEEVPKLLVYNGYIRDRAHQRGIRILFFSLARQIEKEVKTRTEPIAVFTDARKFLPKHVCGTNLHFLGIGSEVPKDYLKVTLPVLARQFGMTINYFVGSKGTARVERFGEFSGTEKTGHVMLLIDEQEKKMFKERYNYEVIEIEPPDYEPPTEEGVES